MRQRIFQHRYDKFEPFKAIGKLMFFDYNKNKFGFISEVKGGNIIQANKVHVSEEGLSTDKRLNDGEVVTLTLNKGEKGFYATDVKSINEVTIKEISDIVALLEVNEISKVVYNTVGNDYNKLDNDDKRLIGKLLLKIRDVSAWNLLVKLEDEKIIETYIRTQIIEMSQEEKITFLQKSFNKNLLFIILSEWTIHEKNRILNLFEIINNKEFSNNQVPISFINIISNLEWSFEEICAINSTLKLVETENLAVNLFSFTLHSNIIKLKDLIPLNLLTEETCNKLKLKFHSEKDNISANQLIKIYTELKDYKIIADENQLLDLLSYTVLNDSEFSELISILLDDCQIATFRKLVSNNVKNISSCKIIELLKSCKHNHELTKVFIDEYYGNYSGDSSPDYQRLIDFLKKKNNSGLSNYFLDKFYVDLSLKFPIAILEFAIQSNHINAQKHAYQNLKFYSENDIVNYIDRSERIFISDEVKKCNQPLSGFIEFIKSTSSFNLTEQCKTFFQIHKGIVQCLSIKFLIYHLHMQSIDKAKLIEILNSFQWTEISALLIKAFIEESNYSEKIVLDKLNGIFKAHFEILSDPNFESKSFLDNFTIRNILNWCNGRKYYSGQLWQQNGVSRWYVSGGAYTITRETLDCYCEGRPWKKETFWDSQTNTPLSEQFEKYWCKTSYCAARNDSVDLTQDFHNWTLSEIATALNIQVEKIALATLAGWVNRMNQIVTHLFCRKCNEVLRPLPFRPGTLGYYAVPLFHCINDNCTEKQVIRFTHCLNGKCESHLTSEPLDSRDCKSCKPNDPNHSGLECNFCGTSCPTCSGHFKKIVSQEVW